MARRRGVDDTLPVSIRRSVASGVATGVKEEDDAVEESDATAATLGTAEAWEVLDPVTCRLAGICLTPDRTWMCLAVALAGDTCGSALRPVDNELGVEVFLSLLLSPLVFSRVPSSGTPKSLLRTFFTEEILGADADDDGAAAVSDPVVGTRRARAGDELRRCTICGKAASAAESSVLHCPLIGGSVCTDDCDSGEDAAATPRSVGEEKGPQTQATGDCLVGENGAAKSTSATLFRRSLCSGA